MVMKEARTCGRNLVYRMNTKGKMNGEMNETDGLLMETMQASGKGTGRCVRQYEASLSAATVISTGRPDCTIALADGFWLMTVSGTKSVERS